MHHVQMDWLDARGTSLRNTARPRCCATTFNMLHSLAWSTDINLPSGWPNSRPASRAGADGGSTPVLGDASGDPLLPLSIGGDIEGLLLPGGGDTDIISLNPIGGKFLGFELAAAKRINLLDVSIIPA